MSDSDHIIEVTISRSLLAAFVGVFLSFELHENGFDSFKRLLVLPLEWPRHSLSALGRNISKARERKVVSNRTSPPKCCSNSAMTLSARS